MQEKRRLLVVGDFNRKDFIEPFYACQADFDIFFIEFAEKIEITSSYYKAYGKAIFWKDFSDAFHLVRKIRPDRVVFYFLESYNHIALNVACKVLGIKTFHLDHGYKDLERIRKMEATRLPLTQTRQNLKVSFSLINKIKTFINKLKTRLFFLNTVRKTTGEAKAFLKKYYQVRKQHSISETFKLVASPFRIADAYIAYCPANFQQFVKQDHLPADYQVFYPGVPTFDKWAKKKPATNLKNYLVFIPQPFTEQGWLGWTPDFEKLFIQELIEVSQAKAYTLFVKLHPYQNIAVWQEFSDRKELTLISEEDLENIIPFTKIVLGFFSTLLIPLAALPNTTVFTFENHPVDSVIPSSLLTKSGVSNQLCSVAALGEAIEKRKIVHEEQSRHKAVFAREWMYYFDGKSGERLREVLLQP